jgi:hypothetical protein
MGVNAYVTVPGAISPDELEHMKSELQAVGLAVDDDDIDTDVSRLTGIEEGLVIAVLVVPVAAFFRALGEQAGKDAYASLKQLASRLRAIRGRSQDGTLVVQDEASGVRVDLGPALDDGAYRALVALDFTSLPEGTLAWDERAGEWVEKS